MVSNITDSEGRLIEVLFEDNHLLVVHKPAGILSQPGPAGQEDMLTQCKEYIREKYNKPGNVFLGLVHRLDWGVSGVMVFARTSKAASRLSEQFRERTVEKRYEAIVSGVVKETAGVLTGRITKDRDARRAELGDGDDEGDDSEEARLSYKRIGVTEVRYKGQRCSVSVLEIQLETGKFHQIRAQLAAAGHPVIGDSKYGSVVSIPGVIIGLRAASLTVNHPTNGERKSFSVARPESWNSAVKL